MIHTVWFWPLGREHKLPCSLLISPISSLIFYFLYLPLRAADVGNRWQSCGLDSRSEIRTADELLFFFGGGERRKLKFNTHPAPRFSGWTSFSSVLPQCIGFPNKNDLVLFRTFRRVAQNTHFPSSCAGKKGRKKTLTIVFANARVPCDRKWVRLLKYF